MAKRDAKVLGYSQHGVYLRRRGKRELGSPTTTIFFENSFLTHKKIWMETEDLETKLKEFALQIGCDIEHVRVGLPILH